LFVFLAQNRPEKVGVSPGWTFFFKTHVGGFWGAGGGSPGFHPVTCPPHGVSWQIMACLSPCPPPEKRKQTGRMFGLLVFWVFYTLCYPWPPPPSFRVVWGSRNSMSGCPVITHTNNKLLQNNLRSLSGVILHKKHVCLCGVGKGQT